MDDIQRDIRDLQIASRLREMEMFIIDLNDRAKFDSKFGDPNYQMKEAARFFPDVISYLGKAMGGPVEGIASLSDTARDMYRGPRGIGSYQQFTEGGGAKSPEMKEGLEDMIRMGLGSSKSLAREGKEAFSEGEYQRAASKYLMSILGKFPITKEFYSGLGSILQRSDTPTDALKNIIYDEEGRFLGASRDFIKSKVKGYAEGGAATARDKVEIEGLRNAVMMTESGGDPNAVSPDGAIGLMQIMLPTARDPGFGVENAFEIAERLGYVFNDTSDETLKRLLFLPDVNVEFGNQYLDAMLNQYSEVDDALRAYNAGKTNVDKFIASGRNLNVLTDEAVQYPIKVTAAMQGFNPKDMNQMEMFRQAPETAVALMEDYPAPPVENRMFSPPPVRPDLPPTFFPSVMPQQRVAEGIETIQPAVPGVIKGQPKKMYQEPEGIATLTTALRPRPRPSQLN